MNVVNCLNCNSEFEQNRKDKVFCSRKCKFKKYQLNNREYFNNISKKYYEDNKECIKKKKKIYEKNNIDKIKETKNNYYKKHKKQLLEKKSLYIKEYFKNKYNNDINFKLKTNLRNRLNRAVKNNQKAGSAVADLGCSIEEFKKYIESLWQPDMTWDNWSRDGWHIDHKIAISKFDLTNPEEFKKACHYTNLQPMWAKDNFKKSDN